MNSPFSALDWLMNRRVHEFIDEVGRPVGEGRAGAFQSVTTEMRTCPYTGGRHRHVKKMNLTALECMPPLTQILTLLSWLTVRYSTRARQVQNSEDLAQVTAAGIFLADYLALRAESPIPSGQMPVIVSGLYKVCLGFQLAYLAERYLQPLEPIPLPDADSFYSYLEDSHLLIGEKEVCSGSPAMVKQAYEAIIHPREVSADDLPPSCRDLQIDWPSFDRFTASASHIWHELVRYAIECARRHSTIAENKTLVLELAEAIASEMPPVADPATEEPATVMLIDLNQTLRHLLSALGSQADHPALDIDQVHQICGLRTSGQFLYTLNR